MQRLLIRGSMVAALALVAIGPSRALPSPSQQSAVRNNCKVDYPKYCPGISTMSMASLHCLQKNSAKLSPACRKAVGAIK